MREEPKEIEVEAEVTQGGRRLTGVARQRVR